MIKPDFYCFSAHKMYGPKGIGVLFVRRKPRVRLEAQMHGGGHERGMRSGTLATHQIVGMGEAAQVAKDGTYEKSFVWVVKKETEQAFDKKINKENCSKIEGNI